MGQRSARERVSRARQQGGGGYNFRNSPVAHTLGTAQACYPRQHPRTSAERHHLRHRWTAAAPLPLACSHFRALHCVACVGQRLPFDADHFSSEWRAGSWRQHWPGVCALPRSSWLLANNAVSRVVGRLMSGTSNKMLTTDRWESCPTLTLTH
jgi:hypothetical protein